MLILLIMLIRATQRLITDQFVWPGINRDIGKWTKSCLPFDHIHLDIVSPLSLSQDYRHLLICVDRYTRWPEAIPIPDITAKAVARVFIARWISVYGVPSTITTNRGAQFEALLFATLKVGVHRTGFSRREENALDLS